MAYSKQTWDTTSYVNPTRMNHIEQGIYDASTATGTEYSSGVSVKQKIDGLIKTKDVQMTSDSNCHLTFAGTVSNPQMILNAWVIGRNSNRMIGLYTYGGAIYGFLTDSASSGISGETNTVRIVYVDN